MGGNDQGNKGAGANKKGNNNKGGLDLLRYASSNLKENEKSSEPRKIDKVSSLINKDLKKEEVSIEVTREDNELTLKDVSPFEGDGIWWINDEEISTDKELTYSLEDYGKYVIKLVKEGSQGQLSDEKTIIYKEAKSKKKAFSTSKKDDNDLSLNNIFDLIINNELPENSDDGSSLSIRISKRNDRWMTMFCTASNINKKELLDALLDAFKNDYSQKIQEYVNEQNNLF